MTAPAQASLGVPAVITRLERLAPLSGEDIRKLIAALGDCREVAPRSEIQREGEAIAEPRLVVSGWAARVRRLADGRRQFLSFLLPGDLIGICAHPQPLAVSTVIALTDMSLCPAPVEGDGLADAYAVSRALEEGYLLCQIGRLGRMNAQERIADLMLELFERLDMAGLTLGNAFYLPLTQELLADALGLTSVHINRMVQSLRREGDLEWRGGRIRLTDPAALARKIGRTPMRVTAFQSAALSG